MLMSKGIEKLETKKGFKCNNICDTCVCHTAGESMRGQFNVYTELHNQGVIPDATYYKKVCVLEKENRALVQWCNKLYGDFLGIVDEKIEDYCKLNNISDIPDEDYEDVVNVFEKMYSGGDRYTR